jgi:adenosylhomocysteine nucleosidase
MKQGTMKRGTAMVAALPRELSALVEGWHCEELPENLFVWSNGRSVAACAGMGSECVARAVRAVLPMRPWEVISVGLAGACDGNLRVGDIIRPGVVIDEKTNERFVDLKYDRNLVSTDEIVNVDKKMRMRICFDAAAVDMEAATVARMAKVGGVKFRAIKAISDEADFEIGDLGKFVTEDGQFREKRFALYAALRPQKWSKVITLGRNSSKALAVLTEVLRSELFL